MADNGSIVVVAIDGPAGSGKSTVARRLAERLGLYYLDTGAMYRAVTLAVLRHNVDPGEGDAVARLAREIDIDLRSDGRVLVDGVDSTDTIRGPAVTAAVSEVAANQDVRRELVERQRRWTRVRGGGVLEGRDIGTAVFPDADLKVYLTASPEVRARRRAGDSPDDDVAAIARDLARRDEYDSGRANDPLRQADDAWIVDTSDLSIEEVVDRLASLVAAGSGAADGAPSTNGGC